MSDIIFNGKSYKPATGNLLGIVDTGTSFIVGPTKLVKEMTKEMTKVFGIKKDKKVDCALVPSAYQQRLNSRFGRYDVVAPALGAALSLAFDGKRISDLAVDLRPAIGTGSILDDVGRAFHDVLILIETGPR